MSRDPWSNFFQNKLLNKLKSTQKKHRQKEIEIIKSSDAVLTTSESRLGNTMIFTF